MNDDPGAWPVQVSLSGGPDGAVDGAPEGWAGLDTADPSEARRKIVFIAWRDLANRHAGGSEVLVDQLATGLLAR
ncbi:MAG TPA: hypothetical protein VG123_41110, partial [Streptosporangiaceae bacterium]|nr:hypothetical protein [Streptosporangiaceae bacterium]